nr:MAG TPA: hypothetical protein [Caudoviricetes sp.]
MIKSTKGDSKNTTISSCSNIMHFIISSFVQQSKKL